MNDTRNCKRNKTNLKYRFGHPDITEGNKESLFFFFGNRYEDVKVNATP